MTHLKYNYIQEILTNKANFDYYVKVMFGQYRKIKKINDRVQNKYRVTIYISGM